MKGHVGVGILKGIKVSGDREKIIRRTREYLGMYIKMERNPMIRKAWHNANLNEVVVNL